MDLQTSQPTFHTMNQNNSKRFSRNRRNMYRKGKNVNSFKEPEKWISNKKKNEDDKKNMVLTEENFPSLTGSNATDPAKENAKIQYSIQELFKKKREKKKKAKELRPGWIRLHYRNGVSCMEFGQPPISLGYDAETKLMEIEIEKMIKRHEIHQEQNQHEHYVPYWKKEVMDIDDEVYDSDYTDSEEDYYEDEIETDEEEYEY